jgi:hypothetical protein
MKRELGIARCGLAVACVQKMKREESYIIVKE